MGARAGGVRAFVGLALGATSMGASASPQSIGSPAASASVSQGSTKGGAAPCGARRPGALCAPRPRALAPRGGFLAAVPPEGPCP